MKQFEYFKASFKDLRDGHYLELDTRKLNELGEDGWELITIHSGECIFKREKKVRQSKLM